jgi:hypothetical protein
VEFVECHGVGKPTLKVVIVLALDINTAGEDSVAWPVEVILRGVVAILEKPISVSDAATASSCALLGQEADPCCFLSWSWWSRR